MSIPGQIPGTISPVCGYAIFKILSVLYFLVPVYLQIIIESYRKINQ
jgi:hypothetical protein